MSKKEENKLPFSISSTKNKIKKLQKLGWKGSVLFVTVFVLLGAMFAYYQRINQSNSSKYFSPNNKLEQTQEKLTVDSISQSPLNNGQASKRQSNQIGEATMTNNRVGNKSDGETRDKNKSKEEVEEKQVNSVPQMSSESVTSQFNNLTMPLQGEIASNCEWYKDQMLDAWKYNPGINIKGEIGDPVKAVQNGKVSKLIRDDYQGLTIIIKHNDKYSSSYSNLEKALVEEGEDVNKSEVIAKLGDSGATDKSELHFEIIKKNKTVNPMDYFN